VTVTTEVYCCSHYSSRPTPQLQAGSSKVQLHQFAAVPYAWLALHIAKCVHRRSLVVAPYFMPGVYTQKGTYEDLRPFSSTNIAHTPVDLHVYLCHIPVSLWPRNVSKR
jgi:hypothetical protein